MHAVFCAIPNSRRYARGWRSNAARFLRAPAEPFDIAFLTAACKACSLPWPEFQVLDTVELAHRVLGEEEVADCKLATLAAHFNARIKPRHRALPDALATADVLTALLRRLAATGVRTLAEAGCV